MEWVNGGGLSCWVEAGVRSGFEHAEQQSPVRQKVGSNVGVGKLPASMSQVTGSVIPNPYSRCDGMLST